MLYWIQNWSGIPQDSIWHHFHWYIFNLRWSMYQKRDKKGEKEPNLCFEASRGFVCCYRKIFSSQNWWRTTEKLISHLFHWYIMKIRCPIDWKQGLESPIWPFFMLFNLILIKYDTFYSSDINVMGVKFIIVMSLISYDFKIFFLNNKQSL